MAKQKRRGLQQKILLPLMLLAIVIFGTISTATAALARNMQMELTTDKLLSDSYNNALLFAKKADEAYRQAEAMAGCLAAYRQLPAEEQRDAVENIIRGILNSNPLYVSGFAYFEEGEMALPAQPDRNEEAPPTEEAPEDEGTPETEETPEPEVPASIAYSSILRRLGDGNEYKSERREDAFEHYSKEFYTRLKADGQTLIIAPYEDEINGKMGMMFSVAAPLYDNEGIFRGTAGLDVDLSKLSDFSFAATGYSSTHMMAIADNGKVLLNTADSSTVGKSVEELNYDGFTETFEEVKSQKSGEDYSNSVSVIREDVINPQTGNPGLSVAVPISLGDGTRWVIQISADNAEIFASIIQKLILLIGSIVVFAVLMMIIMGFLIRRRIAPFGRITQGVEQLSTGNLKLNIDLHTGDELEWMGEALNHTAATLSSYVEDIAGVLTKISKDDLNVSITSEYTGDFVPIKQAIEVIISSLNRTFREISEISNQVSTGSEQVADGAQSLSSGAVEQAESVSKLSANMAGIGSQVHDSANNAAEANARAAQVGKEIDESTRQMQEMIRAMDDITNSSNEIGKIIKTIQDIAFQTNILALNAAVEAARAGSAGKGFAVVADEVRNLATKSAEAAKNTTDLIHLSSQSVANGTQIVDRTAESLTSVVLSVKDVIHSVDKIAAASSSQASAIEEMTESVNSISSVVQTNSVTAEESAAASQELSSQAQALKEMVSRFQFREDSYMNNFSTIV